MSDMELCSLVDYLADMEEAMHNAYLQAGEAGRIILSAKLSVLDDIIDFVEHNFEICVRYRDDLCDYLERRDG